MVEEVVASPISRTRLREIKRHVAIAFAREHGVFSRAQLAEATGLSAATVTRLVRDLLAEGYVVETGAGPSSGGRPQTMLEFQAGNELVAVVDLHDGEIDAALRDWNGDLHGTMVRRPLVDLRRDLPEVIGELRDQVGSRLKATAIAIPGVAMGGEGQIRLAPSIARGEGPALGAALLDALDMPVVVDNDVNLMVVGEHVAGAAVDTDDVFLAHIGASGIGAALMIDGVVRRGARGSAGEIGFMPLGAALAPSSDVGAFEGEWALGALHRRADALLGPGDGPLLERLRDAQVPAARQLLIDALRAWGRAIAAAVCVLDPARVLLSGPRMTDGDLDVLIEETSRFVPGGVDIRPAAIGPRALHLGAARRAFDAHDARSAR
ncbi:ROK family transcriptional regulator [Agromyces silvae]|uniref:ROK family transcriptional regulator n=1 Tax=Agromyces silvae TaxID=3388266 RepID=UPI00280BD16E|nr:ROK family protein [Agromyces protaetiae]